MRITHLSFKKEENEVCAGANDNILWHFILKIGESCIFF